MTACARALRESILSGRIPAGGRLPPERELAGTLGVNRLTLRSALAQIVASGLVSVRQGSGYVVRDFAEEGGADLLAPFLAVARAPATRLEAIADLLLVRRSLARAVLERLAARTDESRTARIQAIVDAFARTAEAPGATVATIAAADRKAIRAIVRETGSTVLMLAANPVFRVADAIPELDREMFTDPSASVDGYRLLAAALASRDPAAVDRVISLMSAADESLVARLSKTRKKKRSR